MNADGFVSPIDVLLIINFLNFSGAASVSIVGLPDPPPYRDVNGNYFIDPLDVLEIINEINRRGNGGVGGEGEGSVDTHSNGSTAAPMNWITDVMRESPNFGTTMMEVPARKPSVSLADGTSQIATSAPVSGLADYLANYGNDTKDEAEKLAQLMTVKKADKDHESLDSFFAEVFG